MMNRRTFLCGLTLGTLSVPLVAEAQPAGKVWRIGCLWGPAPVSVHMDAFRQGLRELGYVEGRDFFIDWRFAEGRVERLPGLAGELVRLKVDAIVTVAEPAALAAQKATSEIPIVFTAVSNDPVALGLVRSLGRPGGNITGLATLYGELTGKRLEILKEAVPSVKSVVILTNTALPTNALAAQQAQDAARRLGLEGRIVGVRHADELEFALTTAANVRAGAVVLMPDPLLYTNRVEIAKLATMRRLPVVGWLSHLAEGGALISYGANAPDYHRRAAYFVDRILKGAKPADLPVEQPTKFELVINLKTAKALGLTIPQALLLRADEVIQ